MSTQHFATKILYQPLVRSSAARINAELLQEAERLRDVDDAGRRWSKKHFPGGYTSYGSLDKLHSLSSIFGAFEERVNKHVVRNGWAPLGANTLRV